MQSLFSNLLWTDVRVDKIEGPEGHGVGVAEVEEAFYDDERNAIYRSRDDRYVLAGRTHSGRQLIVALVDEGRGFAGPISARTPTAAERKRFFGRR